MNSTNLGWASPPPVAVGGSSEKEAVTIPVNGIDLPAELVLPTGAKGLVLFVLARGCMRETPRVRELLQAIEASGIATLALPLLTRPEAEKDVHSACWSFDLELLSHRLLRATKWALHDSRTRDLKIGYMSTGTLAAAALIVAAELGHIVQAVVCRAGRADFAGDSLPAVTAPTLLIVGEYDALLADLNRQAAERLVCPNQLEIIPGASHLFEESGTLEQVGQLAAAWFRRHLTAREQVRA